MPFAFRSVAAFSFVTALAVLSAPGCSQQGEGERCDFDKNGDADCDDGLTCVAKRFLHEGITDRCCPAEGTESDTRCTRATVMTTGGTSSGGTSSSDAGAAGETAGGAAGAVAVSGGAGGESPATSNGGAGSPATSEGGMSGAGGAPVVTDGGTPGASTAGQGGAG